MKWKMKTVCFSVEMPSRGENVNWKKYSVLEELQVTEKECVTDS